MCNIDLTIYNTSESFHCYRSVCMCFANIVEQQCSLAYLGSKVLSSIAWFQIYLMCGEMVLLHLCPDCRGDYLPGTEPLQDSVAFTPCTWLWYGSTNLHLTNLRSSLTLLRLSSAASAGGKQKEPPYSWNPSSSIWLWSFQRCYSTSPSKTMLECIDVSPQRSEPPLSSD